jgi:hypothetical protein
VWIVFGSDETIAVKRAWPSKMSSSGYLSIDQKRTYHEAYCWASLARAASTAAVIACSIPFRNVAQGACSRADGG